MPGRKRGVKNKQQLPSHYDRGFPAINFFLAILLRAKADDAKMWLDFQKTYLNIGNNKDGLEIAEWVAEYLTGGK